MSSYMLSKNISNELKDTMNLIKSIKWIVFDVDGVLIDTSESYDLATKYAAERMLKELGKDVEIDLNVIRDLRKNGGFGEDYELSEALILTFITNESTSLLKEFPKGETVEWFRRNVKLNLDVAYIKRIFDTYYFGNLYEKKLFDFEGLWKNERSLVNSRLLEKLEKYKNLGVITGRTEYELKLAFKIIGYEFENFVTQEVGLKPDPYLLESLVSGEYGIYVGDTLNDEIFIWNYVEKFQKKFEFLMIGRDFENINDFIVYILNKIERGDGN